jgi:hypothetical protein
MQSTSLDFPQWSTLAANDALRCEGGPIRSFLWSVADEDSTPADFESFVIIYDGLNQSVPISSTVELTADLFPRATDGQRLKRALLGDQKAAIIPPVDSKDMLFALATTRNIESFDPKELHLTDHASFLQKNHPALGCRLIVELFRASLNDIGDQILTSLILAARPDDGLLFAPDLKQFLPTLFRVNPKLATSAQLWLVAGDRKRELFESLIVQSGMEPEIQSGIVGALLNSGSDAFLGQTFAEWGGIAVANALEWIEAHDGTMSEMCRGALTSRVADVMDWVTSGREKSAATLIDVAHVVAPYSTQIAHYDSTIWLRTLHAVRENHQEEEANYISAFLLALALCNASPAPLDLVSESFERIHQLQEKDDLADSAWIILQSFVPELSWRKNWDKCERLRRALISAFMRHNWPAHQLRERIKNRELVKQLLKSARKVGGEQYFDHC